MPHFLPRTSHISDPVLPVPPVLPVLPVQEELARHLERLVDLYAVLYTGGDAGRAKDALSKTLRDHIKVWAHG